MYGFYFLFYLSFFDYSLKIKSLKSEKKKIAKFDIGVFHLYTLRNLELCIFIAKILSLTKTSIDVLLGNGACS